ncbi:CRISPR-associated endonuclease Cas2 [Candidatus Parcubacteria bacterium]|nr:CRISPR-associated endonuclease Cas2 [Candidatus Parcubacteria bacterium]
MNRNKKTNIKKIVLTTIATAGLISVVVLAPNALQVIRQFSGKKKYSRSVYVNSTISRLLDKGNIEFINRGNKKFIRLTKKGERELLKYKLGDLKIEKPRRWDKKWRIVIFDIKEKRKRTRNILRKTLSRLGFVKLQNSVWVFPYDCEELIIMMKSDLFVGKDVLYMKVDSIENDRWLKESFNLK